MAVGYPASSPYVTAVGGFTRINSVTWSSPVTSEVAWEFSGGGPSSYAAMAGWQSTFLSAMLVTENNGLRAVPDVAAVADNQHSAIGIYWEDRWGMAGGTSMATPLWAGVSALFGQYLANKGESLPTLIANTSGGFNGVIYESKLMQSAADGFYNISSGSNNLTSISCPLCNAASGYNDVTGLGAPDVANLFSHFLSKANLSQSDFTFTIQRRCLHRMLHNAFILYEPHIAAIVPQLIIWELPRHSRSSARR